MKITIEHLEKIFNKKKEKNFNLTIDTINECIERFDVNICSCCSHIFAHFKEETDYKSFVESLNYDVEGLKRTFRNSITNEEAEKYGRTKNRPANQEMIGEIVYGAKSGKKLGNTNLGDGYKYRGRGLIQITGKTNYALTTKNYNQYFEEKVDFVKNPKLLEDPIYAVKTAFVWMESRGIFKIIRESKNKENIDEHKNTFNKVMDIVNKYTKTRDKRWGHFNEIYSKIFNCSIERKVVVQNNSQIKNTIINQQAQTSTKNKDLIENKVKIEEKDEIEEKKGVYEFNGQKFIEVSESEEYKKDRETMLKAPETVFVNMTDEVVFILLKEFKENSKENKKIIKYLEKNTKKKVLKENKNEIATILKIYENETKDKRGAGNVVRQHNFDILRGRDEKDKKIGIQDIIYYIFSNPIEGKTKIETLEIVLQKFSAKYVIYPDKKPIIKNKKSKEFENNKIKEILNKDEKYNENNKEKEEEYIAKNNLPEKYRKYLVGIKDIDEILIRVEKINLKEENKSNNSDNEILKISRCESLIKELSESEENEKSYSKDENGVRNYPLSRRIIDNIIIEFLKIQVNFKEEKEEKHFDNCKYKDSNILRNYLLWYFENNKDDLILNNRNFLFREMEKLGKELRLTTFLKIWITSKMNNKVKNIRQISLLIDENYSEYRDSSDYEKDKGIIQLIFKDSKELRDYSAEIDSMELYSFYKEFYEIQNIIDPIGNLFVNEKNILKCTFGEDTSKLIINSDKVTIRGSKQANINDKQVLPFKRCRAMGICKPELVGMWDKNTDAKVRGYPALLNISTIQCACGGRISIDSAGQKEIGTAVTKEIQENNETKRDADCIYKLMIDLCKDINELFMQTGFKNTLKNYRKYKKELHKNNNIDEDLIWKEKELKDRIWSKFVEANRVIEQKSSPKLDTKEVILKYGLSACDYENGNFYSTKILPVIVYSYLMEAGKLEIIEEDKKKILNKLLNKKEMEEEIISLIEKYEISSKLKEEKNINQNNEKTQITESDIEKWLKIGKELYVEKQEIPTEWDILRKIRENGKVLTACPFSKSEKDKIHGEAKLNDTTEIKKDTNNSNQNCKVENCPHKGVSGYYTIYVERIEETINDESATLDKGDANKKNATLSNFCLLDPNNKIVENCKGIMVEPGGPDQKIRERNQRIVQGTHNLLWHIKTVGNYKTLKIYSKDIPADRAILIHPGNGRSSTIGCLIPGMSYNRSNDVQIYKTIESKKMFDKLMYEVKKIEGEKDNRIKKGKLEKVKILVKNNITKVNRGGNNKK